MDTERKLRETRISGEKKGKYLADLDASMRVLSRNLKPGASDENVRRLKEFGNKESWDWTRIPKIAGTYHILSALTDRIRKEYSLFRWFDKLPNPYDNRGYFEDVGISDTSGLPWSFDFIRLHSIKEKAAGLIEGGKSYEDLVEGVRILITGDDSEIEDVTLDIQKLRKEALKRNFLENLVRAELLDWKFSGNSRIFAKKLIPLGGEELWNLSFIRYHPSVSMFEAYIIDLWQDLRDPKICCSEGKVSIDPELISTFNYGHDNAAYFIISEIDNKFSSLHPVHVSKALVGPFENRFLTSPEFGTLPFVPKMLSINPDAGVLRFSRQYAYAPNHIDTPEGLRQIIYPEAWSDEVIVCPKGFGKEINKSVLGSEVKILEA
jgi:hypothetical protein